MLLLITLWAASHVSASLNPKNDHLNYQELSASLAVFKLQLNQMDSPSWVGSNWKRQAIWWTAALLLLSGDIHLNPGPPRHLHSCVLCSKVVRQVGIKCDICRKWCHPKGDK